MQLTGKHTIVKKWAKRALALFAVAFVLDVFVLVDGNGFDDFLTSITAELSGGMAKWVNPTQVSVGPNGGGWSVYENGQSKVFIGDACNARNIFFLYIGFLVSIPMGNIPRKLRYLGIGLLLIFIFNVLRVFALFSLAANMPAIFDFTHKYLFQISIYILLFYLWHRYLTPYSQDEETV